MTDTSLYSVYLFSIAVAMDDRMISGMLFRQFVECQALMGCLLCDENCGPGHRHAPFVVVGYDEASSKNNFLSLICDNCADDNTVDELKPLVFAAIKEKVLIDAQMVSADAVGSA